MRLLRAAVGAMSEGGPSCEGAPVSGARLEVEVVHHGEAWDESGVSDAYVRRAAEAALASTVAPEPGLYEATILLTDDEEMRALNRTWRGKNKPTNVLSFPANEGLPRPGLLGDVAIAYETAVDEAQTDGLAFADHVAHLVVHGILHLFGYDHAADDEAERMENLEIQALASIGIADPYREKEAAPHAEISP
jgi:probable rRNA maturation factor